MNKRVLDVGQCSPDHSRIRTLLESMHARAVRCPLPSEAMELLRREEFDLVLVNRKIDMDYSDGIDLIRMMKEDSTTSHIPVMLVSNFPEYQRAAVEAGALHGFGKEELSLEETKERLRTALEM